jgi:hypothetical protein
VSHQHVFCGAFHLGWELLKNGRYHKNANVVQIWSRMYGKWLSSVLLQTPSASTKSGTLNSQNVCFYVQDLGPLHCGISLFAACLTLSKLQYSNLYSSILYFFLSRKRNVFPETSNCVKFLKNEFIWTGIRLLFSLSTYLSLLGTVLLDSLTILPPPPSSVADHYGD